MKESYISAGVFPTKLLQTKVMYDGKIRPIHVQFIPTNRCNLSCSFCSCDDRDKKLEFSYQEAKDILDRLKKLGTKSITITGGGEPMLHPQINEIINYAKKLDIQTGLVTNGLLIDKLNSSPTWCRISSGDDRIPSYNKIESALKNKTDFAFSHVVSKNPNYWIISGIISFANKHKFTHVRLVNDLFDLKNSPDMDTIKKELMNIEINDDLVIYQGRKKYTRGTDRCLISLLKPVISPDKRIYPCCGSQYSVKGQRKDMVLGMGDLDNLEKIIEQQKYFKGKICDVCYYSEYNKALDLMTKKVEHKRFV